VADQEDFGGGLGHRALPWLSLMMSMAIVSGRRVV
jgi:hypothetical protein